MYLIKFLSRCGICARRKVKELLEQKVVKINGQVVEDQFYEVSERDAVTVHGERVGIDEHVYILLNKPKDYITTCHDTRERKTVLELVKNATKKRIYPVGRLDRATTGLLFLTNDGDLAQKLSHPSSNIAKGYLATLDKSFSKSYMQKLFNGITLEDGPIKVDGISFGKNKKEVIVEIHSGRKWIVRRMFSHLLYKVKSLDRIFYAGLTKKDLPRGSWRFLTKREVIDLKKL